MIEFVQEIIVFWDNWQFSIAIEEVKAMKKLFYIIDSLVQLEESTKIKLYFISEKFNNKKSDRFSS